MKYTVNLLGANDDPVAWARRREAEGWDSLSVADHFFTGTRAYGHVFVSAAAMAMATESVAISTAFVNNLFRSPVEVAQAALQLQRISGGRFELGLGAGWAEAEATGAGIAYPDPAIRASMFIEAVQIVRHLLHEGSCRFEGQHYGIDVPTIGPFGADVDVPPPPLIGSVGGRRTAREVTPHLDRVEIKAQSSATRGGDLDLVAMSQVTDEHLLDMVRRVREAQPGVEISMFTLFSVGGDPITRSVADVMRSGGGMFRRFFGSPEQVADGLAWLESVGIARASLSPMTDDALALLAPKVLG